MDSSKYRDSITLENNLGRKKETKYRKLTLTGDIETELNSHFFETLEDTLFPSFDLGISNESNDTKKDILYQDLRDAHHVSSSSQWGSFH